MLAAIHRICCVVFFIVCACAASIDTFQNKDHQIRFLTTPKYSVFSGTIKVNIEVSLDNHSAYESVKIIAALAHWTEYVDPSTEDMADVYEIVETTNTFKKLNSNKKHFRATVKLPFSTYKQDRPSRHFQPASTLDFVSGYQVVVKVVADEGGRSNGANGVGVLASSLLTIPEKSRQFFHRKSAGVAESDKKSIMAEMKNKRYFVPKYSSNLKVAKPEIKQDPLHVDSALPLISGRHTPAISFADEEHLAGHSSSEEKMPLKVSFAGSLPAIEDKSSVASPVDFSDGSVQTATLDRGHLTSDASVQTDIDAQPTAAEIYMWALRKTNYDFSTTIKAVLNFYTYRCRSPFFRHFPLSFTSLQFGNICPEYNVVNEIINAGDESQITAIWSSFSKGQKLAVSPVPLFAPSLHAVEVPLPAPATDDAGYVDDSEVSEADDRNVDGDKTAGRGESPAAEVGRSDTRGGGSGFYPTTVRGNSWGSTYRIVKNFPPIPDV